MLKWIYVSFVCNFVSLMIATQGYAGMEMDRARIIQDLIPITGDEGKVQERRIDLEINFNSGSSQLSKTGVNQVDELAQALRSNELNDAIFKIVGHTDASGDAQKNMALSKERARTVKRVLVESGIFAPDRFYTSGKGERELKNTKDPRAQENRRVEIIAVYGVIGRDGFAPKTSRGEETIIE